MENLTYLYILAEEADRPVTSSAPAGWKAVKQQETPVPLQAQAVQDQKSIIDDCDRANQSYPTFYL